MSIILGIVFGFVLTQFGIFVGRYLERKKIKREITQRWLNWHMQYMLGGGDNGSPTPISEAWYFKNCENLYKVIIGEREI